MRLVLALGLRGLAAGWGTTAMLVLAVALGTAFQIPNAANLEGLHAALLDDGLGYGAGDIRIEPRDRGRFADGAEVLAAVRRTSQRLPVRAAAAVLVFPGSLRVRGGKFFGAPITGVDLDQPHPYHVLEGQDLAAATLDEVLVGATIAHRLGLRLGDPVELAVLYGSAQLGDNLGRLRARVRGIVTSSSGAYRSVYVARGPLGDAAGTPKGATSIAIHLEDHAAARALVPVFAAALPDARVVAWRDDEPGFASYLDARAAIAAVSYAMVIAAVAIPMWALLAIQLLRRRRELAILRGLGFARREIVAICVIQALAIGVLGCALGAGLGALAIGYFAAHPLFEWESLRVVPVASLATFAIPCLVILGTSAIAALLPAWRAARLAPAGVLRRLE